MYAIKGIDEQYETWDAAREDLIKIQNDATTKFITLMNEVAQHDAKLSIGLKYIQDALDFAIMDYENSPSSNDEWFVNDLITEVE